MATIFYSKLPWCKVGNVCGANFHIIITFCASNNCCWIELLAKIFYYTIGIFGEMNFLYSGSALPWSMFAVGGNLMTQICGAGTFAPLIFICFSLKIKINTNR